MIALNILTVFAALASATGQNAPPAVQPVTMTVRASDGTVVSIYEYRPQKLLSSTPLLMFHQAGGDARGELGPIAENLARDGRLVFTADLRSGGDRFGGTNATAAAYKGSDSGYCEVYPDLVAALRKASSEAGRPIALVGSSYSAALVVKLAAEYPGQVAGVASFSPAGGEVMKGCEPEPFLARVADPVLTIRNKASLTLVPWIAESNRQWASAGHPVTMLAVEGHGASLLLAERSKGDVAAVNAAFDDFLRRVDSNEQPAR